MTDPDQLLPDRWLCTGAALIKVPPPSTGPDVFCKLLDAEAAIATERARADARLDELAKQWSALLLEEKARADALQAENALLKNAVEDCFDTVQSMDWLDSDSDAALRRTTLRRLNEAVGKALPRLLMEKPEGQKLYALRWNELTERADALEAALRRLWPVFDKATKGLVFTAERAGEVAADMNTLRALLEKKT